MYEHFTVPARKSTARAYEYQYVSCKAVNWISDLRDKGMSDNIKKALQSQVPHYILEDTTGDRNTFLSGGSWLGNSSRNMSSFTESPKRSSHDDTVLATAGGGRRSSCSGAKLVVSRPLFAAELAEGASVRTGALIAELAEGASVRTGALIAELAEGASVRTGALIAELAEGASVWTGALIAEPCGFPRLSANESVVAVGANEWPMMEESLEQVTSKIN